MVLPKIYEGHCIADVRDVAPWAVIIGVLSLPCLFIGPSFQYAKFFKTRSADGVSALTLATGSLARGLTVVNLIILHYDQMYRCYHLPNPPSWYKCQSSFLVLYSGILGFFAYIPQYIVLVGLIDKKKDPTYHSQARWGGVVIALILVSVLLPISASIAAGSCHAAETYAVVIGFISTLFLCLQFTPQLYTSLQYKSAGSMSYFTYGLDVLGGLIILQAKLFGTREDISTWLPTLIMHAFEAVIVGVNLYNDWERGVLKYSLLTECWFLPDSWRQTSPHTWESEITPLIMVKSNNSNHSRPMEAELAPRTRTGSRALYSDPEERAESLAPSGWELPVTPRVPSELTAPRVSAAAATATPYGTAPNLIELDVEAVDPRRGGRPTDRL